MIILLSEIVLVYHPSTFNIELGATIIKRNNNNSNKDNNYVLIIYMFARRGVDNNFVEKCILKITVDYLF